MSQDSANLAIAEVTNMRYPNISNRAVVGGPITITSFRVFARGHILMERRAARGDWRRCAPVGRDGCRGGGPGLLRFRSRSPRGVCKVRLGWARRQCRRARSGDLADLRCV